VAEGRGNVWEGKKLTRLLPALHPVVRVHPETGRKNLYVNPKFTLRIADLPEGQSAGLLRLLYDHMANPAFVLRYHWSPGTLGFCTSGSSTTRASSASCTGSPCAATGRLAQPERRQPRPPLAGDDRFGHGFSLAQREVAGLVDDAETRRRLSLDPDDGAFVRRGIPDTRELRRCRGGVGADRPEGSFVVYRLTMTAFSPCAL